MSKLPPRLYYLPLHLCPSLRTRCTHRRSAVLAFLVSFKTPTDGDRSAGLKMTSALGCQVVLLVVIFDFVDDSARLFSLCFIWRVRCIFDGGLLLSVHGLSAGVLVWAV